MAERVVVRVPATVANLGPGFDCLGLAIGWHNEVAVERADALEVTATGAGAGSIPRNETNLVVRGLVHVLGEQPRVRVHQMLAIPFGRGFGSSAAAIVAGLVAGYALDGEPLAERPALDAAVALEGHADNVGPCLLGGFTIAAGGTAVRLDAAPDLRVLACVSPEPYDTGAARQVLPDRVPLPDAVLNLARASMLTAAITTGRPDLLLSATDDRLHQPLRLAAMPDSADVLDGLRGRGIAAFLSGAGPSISAIVTDAAAEESQAAARAVVPPGWEVGLYALDDGAAIVDVE